MVTLHGQQIEVGDRVWSIQHGWVSVKGVVDASEYPISINGNRYTREGLDYKEDMYPSLFWQEGTTPPEALIKPLPQLEVNTKVLVWGKWADCKHKRHFSHFLDKGKICCFDNGATSWSSEDISEWDNWELYKEETK